jgi:hypothetical protein
LGCSSALPSIFSIGGLNEDVGEGHGVLRDGYCLGDLVQLCLIDYQAQKEIGKKWQCNP